MEDTSLDEFFESDGEGIEKSEDVEDEEGKATEGDAGTETGDGQDTEGVTPDVNVEPATATAQWTSAGSDCERCETTANRLWCDDDALVCRDCKDW